jgi:hypothetical protein
MRLVDAGPLVFGVEPREINDAVFDEHFDADARATTTIAELRVGAGTDDGGVSVHVFDAATMTEHLRFDCFEENPHYHYQCPGADHVVVTYDSAAHGPMEEWVVERVRSGRLSAMLRHGGAPDLADLVERHDLTGVVPALLEEMSRPVTTKETA